MKNPQAVIRTLTHVCDQEANLRILIEKHSNYDIHLCHNFIDFKKAFHRVWDEALLLTLKKHNIHSNIVHLIGSLHENTSCGFY